MSSNRLTSAIDLLTYQADEINAALKKEEQKLIIIRYEFQKYNELLQQTIKELSGEKNES